MVEEAHVIAGKDLHRYWQRRDALEEFHKLFNERGVVDERAIAIVGVTFLDSILEHTLINFMIDDEKEASKLLGLDRPLGTFSSRVTAAYCLGLICKTVRDDLRWSEGYVTSLLTNCRHPSTSNPYAGGVFL